MSGNKYFCPCCGYKALAEQASYDICGVCGWEDDGGDPYSHSMCNHITLWEYQRAWASGAPPQKMSVICNPHKPPLPERDRGWKLLEDPRGWLAVVVEDDNWDHVLRTIELGPGLPEARSFASDEEDAYVSCVLLPIGVGATTKDAWAHLSEKLR